MNQIILRVTLNDGTTWEVNTSAGDVIKWEAYFDLGIDKLEKFTHLYYLAWLASKRIGKVAAEFEAWTETVTNVEVDDSKKA
jgi:hypothetical protein